ncbi:MAG TPA: peptide deformylase [bacterium]|nr:peptide deformylase [bacterium]
MEIITVDSPKASILRRRAQPVRTVTREIRGLIDQMFHALQGAHGLGLAAPQVGVSRRLFVARLDDRQIALADPELLHQEGEQVATEACLSIPGLLGDVARATRVTVRGRNRHNRFVTIEATGLLARVLLHEIDHLNGILFTDRVQDPKTLRRVEGTSEVAPATVA